MWIQNLGMCGAFGGGMEGDLTYLNSEVSSIWGEWGTIQLSNCTDQALRNFRSERTMKNN